MNFSTNGSTHGSTNVHTIDQEINCPHEHPYVCTSARLHVCMSARPHVRTSARLYVCTWLCTRLCTRLCLKLTPYCKAAPTVQYNKGIKFIKQSSDRVFVGGYRRSASGWSIILTNYN